MKEIVYLFKKYIYIYHTEMLSKDCKINQINLFH